MRYSAPLTLLASASRSATTNSATMTCPDDADGMVVFIDNTAIGVAPSTVFNIQGYDDVADDWYTILASAAVTAVSFTALRVGLGVAIVANASSGDPLPRAFRINAVHGNANAHTYSVQARFWSRH